MSTATAKNIHQALLKAQGEMGPLLKNASNPHFKSKYADLSTVIDTISEPLNNNGLVFVQRFETFEGNPVLATDLIHADSGTSITSVIPITCKDPNNPQAIGAAITYMRRFSLMAIAGLAPEDDDGQAATRVPQPRPQPIQIAPASTETNDAEANESFDGRLADALEMPSEPQKKLFNALYKEAVDEKDTDKLRLLIKFAPTYAQANNILNSATDKHGLNTQAMVDALKHRDDAPAEAEFVDVSTGEIEA